MLKQNATTANSSLVLKNPKNTHKNITHLQLISNNKTQKLFYSRIRALNLEHIQTIENSTLQRAEEEIRNAREDDPQAPKNLMNSIVVDVEYPTDENLIDIGFSNREEIAHLEKIWKSNNDSKQNIIKGKRRNRRIENKRIKLTNKEENSDELDMEKMEKILLNLEIETPSTSDKTSTRNRRFMMSAAAMYERKISNIPMLNYKQEKYLGNYIKIGNKVLNVYEILEKRLKKKPTLKQVSKVLSVEPSKIQKCLEDRERAMRLLYRYNLRFAYSVVKGYKNVNADFDDLFSSAIGPKGLERAVEKFDPDKGFRFTTYAMYWIRCALSICILSENRVIKIPGYVSANVSKYLNAKQQYIAKYGSEPTNEQISKIIGIPKDKLNLYLKVTAPMRSIDEKIGASTHKMESENESLGDILSFEDNPIETYLNKVNLKESIDLALSTLKPIERKIIQLRYGLLKNQTRPKTFHELCDIFEMSLSTLQKLEARALEKLRKPWRKNMISEKYSLNLK